MTVPVPPHDVANIAHVDLLTPEPDRSLRFFHDVLGMEEQSRAGQSVFLRGWGEYQTYSLKLSGSGRSGIGHTALRAWSPEALGRRVAAIEATASAAAGSTATTVTVRPTGSATPTATRSSCSSSASATRRPSTCAPRCATSHSATPRAAPRSNGSTTSTCSRATSRPAGSSPRTHSATATTRASCSTTAARPAPG